MLNQVLISSIHQIHHYKIQIGSKEDSPDEVELILIFHEMVQYHINLFQVAYNI
jgi:hypothetical protein